MMSANARGQQLSTIGPFHKQINVLTSQANSKWTNSKAIGSTYRLTVPKAELWRQALRNIQKDPQRKKKNHTKPTYRNDLPFTVPLTVLSLLCGLISGPR